KYRFFLVISFLFYALIPDVLDQAQDKIRSDITSLLDPESKLLQDYHSSKEKFSKTDYFILIFEHENPEKLKEFHHQFSETLVHEKIDLIEKQLSHVKESISFFKQYAPLYYGSEIYQNILNE